MDAKTAAYLRERRELTGLWSVTPRIIAALIGAVIAAVVPVNPTGLPDLVFVGIKAIAGIVIVEGFTRAWRFVWTAPRKQHVDMLRRVDEAEKRSASAVRDNDDKWIHKTDVYRRNIESGLS